MHGLYGESVIILLWFKTNGPKFGEVMLSLKVCVGGGGGGDCHFESPEHQGFIEK